MSGEGLSWDARGAQRAAAHPTRTHPTLLTHPAHPTRTHPVFDRHGAALLEPERAEWRGPLSLRSPLATPISSTSTMSPPNPKDKKKPKRKHHNSPKSTHQAKDKRRPPHVHAQCSASKKKKAKASSSVLASFRQKLQGSKFRWLNEQLYTQTSDSSCALIEQNPQYFEQYHAGYREVGIGREERSAKREERAG